MSKTYTKNYGLQHLGIVGGYDMRSRVVAWKMGYAKQLLMSKRVKPLVRDYFPATTLFLVDKADFMSTVRFFTLIGNPRNLKALMSVKN